MMTKSEKRNEIERIKSEVNVAKSRLIDMLHELLDIGAVREANSLETIIIKLETWQNK